MADEKKNAQVTGGINDDIKEMKSLTTLRQRVVSDGEVVSKSENGFRLARGNTGVILRNDGSDFYMLTTKDGQAQDGEWNTLRPFTFNLKTGRVSLRNGVDISGGTFVSHNAGITAQTTGPDPLIKGQEYNAPEIATEFTTGKTTVRMLTGARISQDNQDYGMVSYRDRQGEWNELRLRHSSELEVGQLTKRNTEGWLWAGGNRNVNDTERQTNGLHLQGAGDLSAQIFHYERVGQHHFLGIHVAKGGADAWYEFRNNGEFVAGNQIHAGNATLAADGNVNGPLWGGWLNDWLNNAFWSRDSNINNRATWDYVNNDNTPTVNAANRGAIDDRIRWWLANQGAGAVGTCGLFYNLSGHDINPNDIIPGHQLRWSSAGERQGGAPDGSWRALGTVNASKGYDGDEVTLYVRVS
ncbi:hypothetical protein [Pluralibacter gergoviae]|uniref:phage tail fiber protein n=1 Tax=Pluralibacter gergoviae TaxID=61647 RepID=UPI00069EE549|nr:hypothetical protein [Pluralibacter gergoviae]